MNHVIRTLLEITVYSGLIWAVIMLFKKIFKTKLSPALHLGVWLLLIARLLLPVTFESDVHLFTYPSVWLHEQQVEEISPQRELPTLPIKNNDVQSGEDFTQQRVSQDRVNTKKTDTTGADIPMRVSWSWQKTLIIIWVAGMGLSWVYRLGAYHDLIKIIRCKAVPSTPEIDQLFEECKRDLGIQKNIQLTIQNDAVSPALLFPSTVVLPKNLLEMEKKQIKMAMLHELTHYSRKDHLVNMLLMILHSVYWFNPIVWIAFRQLRTDIEIACDSDVVKNMQMAERNGYAHTILALFDRECKENMMLGMAFGGARQSAEQRIREIYRKHKSKKSAMLALALVAVLLLISCFTTACQPTPTKEVVVNRNEGKLEEAIEKNVLTKEYTAPERWTAEPMTGMDGKLSISFDANVTLPDRKEYPIYEIMPTTSLTQERFDQMAEAYFGDAPLYQSPEYPVERIEEWIVGVKEAMAEMEANQFDFTVYDTYDGTEESKQAIRDDMKELLTEYEEEYTQAVRTTEENLPANTDISTGEVSGSTTERRGEWEILQVTMNEDFFDVRMGVDALTLHGNITFDASVDELPLDGLKRVTQQEAQVQAGQLLEYMGLENYSLKKTAITRRHTGSEGDSQMGNPYAFCFEYTQNTDGIVIGETAQWGDFIVAEGGYAPSYEGDSVRIYIDDEGVAAFSWNSPYEVTGMASKNVELLPFEEVAERVEQNLFLSYQNDFEENSEIMAEGLIKKSIEVVELRLEYAVQLVKDKPGTYHLLPVWNVYTTEMIHYKYIDPDTGEWAEYNSEEHTEKEAADHLKFEEHPTWTINAVDGSAVG